MTRLVTTLLILFATTQVTGAPDSFQVTRYDTPVQISATGYVGSSPDTDWALPTLARKAMKSMKFEEWKRYWSEGFFEKTMINREKFQSLQTQTSPADDVIWSIFAEVRIQHDGADYILLYGCAFPRSEFPATEEELGAMVSTDFLRFEGGKWINWTVPHDMDFSAPITKLIDYREVMGFK